MNSSLSYKFRHIHDNMAMETKPINGLAVFIAFYMWKWGRSSCSTDRESS